MNRTQAIAAIQATLKAGETLEIRVTNARGRTLVHHYTVTPDSAEYTGRSWNGYGNLMDTYRTRVIGAR